ncbi:MAG: hypothetical protein ACXW4B_09145 [Micavibrio sp.]
MKKNLALIAMAFTALSLAACDQDDQSKTETTETVITSEGTEIQTKTESDITVDEQGNRTGTYESTTTVDPEGPLNKETTSEIKQDVQ